MPEWTQKPDRKPKGKRAKLRRHVGPLAAPESPARIPTCFVIGLSDYERGIVTELAHRGGFTNLDDVVRLGLWHLARHFDIALPVETFGVGKRGRK